MKKNYFIILLITCLYSQIGWTQEFSMIDLEGKELAVTYNAKMAVFNYDITLLPSQVFDGYLRFRAGTSTSLNFQVNNLPFWLTGVIPNSLSTTGCTDPKAIKFSFTAPSTTGNYTYTLIEGNNNADDIKINLTVTNAPTADTVTVITNINEVDTIAQTLSWNGITYSGSCPFIYYPGLTRSIDYSVYPTTNGMSITPSSLVMDTTQDYTVYRTFSNSIAGNYTTLEVIHAQWSSQPFFTYFEHKVLGDTLSSCTSSFQFREISTTRFYKGGPYTGTIAYRCAGTGNGSIIDKPIILVEGFEVGTANFNESSVSSRYPVLVDNLEAEGYDIIFLDLHKNNGYIQNNAYLLQEVIREVNSISGVDSLVIVGTSMGGLIARYALAEMEQRGEAHKTRIYCSVDSPHRGANIPLGFQYLGEAFGIKPLKGVNLVDFWLKKQDNTDSLRINEHTTLLDMLLYWGDGIGGISDIGALDSLYRSSKSPAAGQMLVLQSEELDLFNVLNYTHSGNSPQSFDNFMVEYHNLGSPQDCKTLAVSNSSICNIEDLEEKALILEYEQEFDFTDSLHSSGFFNDSDDIFKVTLNLNAKHTPENMLGTIFSGSLDVIYHQDLGFLNINLDLTLPIANIKASDTIKRDFESGGIWRGETAGEDIEFSFIPTHSALDIPRDSVDYDTSGFDNYIKVAPYNTPHVSLDESSVITWLLDELKGTVGNAQTCSDAFPDLDITETVFDPDTLKFALGDSFEIKTTIENIGFIASDTATTISYYLSTDDKIDPTDLLLGINSIMPLIDMEATQDSIQIVLGQGIANGSYFILIDIDSAFQEMTYANNGEQIQIEIIDINNNIIPIINLPTQWAVTETGNIHSILLLDSTFTTIKGTQLQEGDYIGAFYDDNGVEKCAASKAWENTSFFFLNVYGDVDSTTTIKEGFAVGETIQLKVYRSAIEEEFDLGIVYRAIVADTSNTLNATENFQIDGISLIDSIYTTDTLRFPLTNNWTIIGSPIIPPNSSIETIFAPIESNLGFVKNGVGDVYIPDPFLGVNSIGNWNMPEGYQVKMKQADTLTIIGQSIVPELTPISLQSGWQIIDYYRRTPMSVDTVVENILSDIALIKDGDGNTFIPSFSINDINEFTRGQGYKVKMINAATLTYKANPLDQINPDGLGGRGVSPIHFTTPIANTGNNATIVFTSSSLNNQLQIGDEIGVFNTQGILAGVGIYNGENFAITVWADDATTTVSEGFVTNEAYTYRIWFSTHNIEDSLQVTAYQVGDDKYAKDKLSVVQDIQVNPVSTTTIQGLSDIQCFPNPASEQVTFRLNLTQSETVTLQLLNVKGQQYQLLDKVNLTKGEHTIPYALTNLASGVYFYQVIVDGQVFTERFTVVK